MHTLNIKYATKFDLEDWWKIDFECGCAVCISPDGEVAEVLHRPLDLNPLHYPSRCPVWKCNRPYDPSLQGPGHFQHCTPVS